MKWFGIFSLLAFFLFPQIVKGEIATVRDWVGLFPINAGDGKANTFQGCTGLTTTACWVYSSTCSQATPPAGTLPRLDRSSNPCIFSFNVLPTAGYYVYRLYANNTESTDALISTSNPMYVAGGGGTPSPTPTPAIVNGKLYRITGNLTINKDITVAKTGVIFIDGNLFINQNLTNTNAKTGLVFIVNGTIYISRDVTTVNAFLIAHTGFCSAYNPVDGIPTCSDYTNAEVSLGATRQYLTINGSVISLNVTSPPQFVRQKSTSLIPAETINYEPKYLVIMKDIFSRDLKIWREIQ